MNYDTSQEQYDGFKQKAQMWFEFDIIWYY
jgi:hypothetical protein